MTVPATEDEARRRDDETIRRLRAESGRRAEGQRRWRAFSSWCALASLAGGISLAALDAHDAWSQHEEALRAAAARDARVANACAERWASLATITTAMNDRLARAKTEDERARVRAQAAAQWVAAMKGAAAAGCGDTANARPAWGAGGLSPGPRRPQRYFGSGEPIVGL